MKRRALLFFVAVAALLPAGCGAGSGVQVNVSSRPSPVYNYETVESAIDGEFEGWDGDTIFQLENGQVWQQSSYAYTYHYAYNPDVLIFDDGGEWTMKVEGVDETITVERLK